MLILSKSLFSFGLNQYSKVEIIPLKKSSYCFFCGKEYAKQNNIKKFEDIDKCKFIFPKTHSAKNRILNEYIKENNLEINSNYEVSSTSIMKKMVLNNIGIGFAKAEALDDIKDEIKIIKKISKSNSQEGIATLKKTMSNKATIELVKFIKEYYKENL